MLTDPPIDICIALKESRHLAIHYGHLISRDYYDDDDGSILCSKSLSQGRIIVCVCLQLERKKSFSLSHKFDAPRDTFTASIGIAKC